MYRRLKLQYNTNRTHAHFTYTVAYNHVCNAVWEFFSLGTLADERIPDKRGLLHFKLKFVYLKPNLFVSDFLFKAVQGT